MCYTVFEESKQEIITSGGAPRKTASAVETATNGGTPRKTAGAEEIATNGGIPRKNSEGACRLASKKISNKK